MPAPRISTLAELRASGWRSRSVKDELRANLTRALASSAGGGDLFPGIVGYDDTVLPEIANAVLAGHDMLFLGEKGQGKSRLMRLLPRFLDEWIPYLDIPGCPVHEDPERPITRAGREALSGRRPEEVPIAWWHRDARYAERLAPGTKFADLIGEIDPREARRRQLDGCGGGAPLRAGAAHAPRHLRDERAPPTWTSWCRWASSTCSRSATSRSAATR